MPLFFTRFVSFVENKCFSSKFSPLHFEIFYITETFIRVKLTFIDFDRLGAPVLRVRFTRENKLNTRWEKNHRTAFNEIQIHRAVCTSDIKLCLLRKTPRGPFSVRRLCPIDFVPGPLMLANRQF